MGSGIDKFTLKNGLAVKSYSLKHEPIMRMILAQEWARVETHPQDFFVLEFDLEPHKLYCVTHKSCRTLLITNLNQAILNPAGRKRALDIVRGCSWAFFYRENGYGFKEDALEYFVTAIVRNLVPEIVVCCGIV